MNKLKQRENCRRQSKPFATMREDGNESNEGKKEKCETLWIIFKIVQQMSIYVYNLYYDGNEISEEMYAFYLEQGPRSQPH